VPSGLCRTKHGRFRGRATAQHHRAVLIPGHRAGVAMGAGLARSRPLDTITSPRLDQIRGVRRIDDVVRVAMEDDRAHARDISAARPP
jgi:hypothetical protein